ncbi:hypothetical protein BDZ45DRAFT_804280 [Acephala macrosclerotiorum]|nr:hypothetical protein BDZ45DRAFT_804280 [Acephala macrosclerotiorum]
MQSIPFPAELELRPLSQNPSEVGCLPGYSHVSLNDRSSLADFLNRELLTPALDMLVPKLSWVAVKSGTRIYTLSELAFRNRKIVITEDPQLHMVFDDQRMFLKLIPEYLLSYDFWGDYLMAYQNPDDKVERAAPGFMRSYYFLIRHRSDFIIPQQCGLVPEHLGMTYQSFSKFTKSFENVVETSASPRYQFGILKLSTLNVLGSMFLRHSKFRVTPNYLVGSAFVFGRFMGDVCAGLKVLLGRHYCGSGVSHSFLFLAYSLEARSLDI